MPAKAVLGMRWPLSMGMKLEWYMCLDWMQQRLLH